MTVCLHLFYHNLYIHEILYNFRYDIMSDTMEVCCRESGQLLLGYSEKSEASTVIMTSNLNSLRLEPGPLLFSEEKEKQEPVIHFTL